MYDDPKDVEVNKELNELVEEALIAFDKNQETKEEIQNNEDTTNLSTWRDKDTNDNDKRMY